MAPVLRVLLSEFFFGLQFYADLVEHVRQLRDFFCAFCGEVVELVAEYSHRFSEIVVDVVRHVFQVLFHLGRRWSKSFSDSAPYLFLNRFQHNR